MLLATVLLASVGGRYSWPLLPALATAAGLFLLSKARVGVHPWTRALDAVIVAGLALVGAQLIPLPPDILRVLSPATPNLRAAYALSSPSTWGPISIDPSATRVALIVALMAALVFWTSREAFSHGGSRAATRFLAVVGFVCGCISLAQHATAPHTVLWRWTVSDPRAMPFGPFVDRNQLATWLVLAIAVVAGSLVMHVFTHASDRTRTRYIAVTDGTSIGMAACIALMVLTLAATLSRSGMIALVAAVIIGTSARRQDRRHVAWASAVAVFVLVALAAWVNADGFADRVTTSVTIAQPGAIGRLTIWREALRICRAFPLLGTGVGTFADAMFVYQRTARDVLFNHGHNEYVQMAVEGGLAMLTTVVAGMVLLARAARTAIDADTSTYRFIRAGACAGLGAIAVQSLWETGLRAPANLVLAAILAGMSVAIRGVSAEDTTTS